MGLELFYAIRLWLDIYVLLGALISLFFVRDIQVTWQDRVLVAIVSVINAVMAISLSLLDFTTLSTIPLVLAVYVLALSPGIYLLLRQRERRLKRLLSAND